MPNADQLKSLQEVIASLAPKQKFDLIKLLDNAASYPAFKEKIMEYIEEHEKILATATPYNYPNHISSVAFKSIEYTQVSYIYNNNIIGIDSFSYNEYELRMMSKDGDIKNMLDPEKIDLIKKSYELEKIKIEIYQFSEISRQTIQKSQKYQ